MLQRSAAGLFICLIAATPGVAERQSSDRTPDKVYQPGNGVSMPTVLKHVYPHYTAEAMRAKIQGSVIIECLVQPDGTVHDVTVVQSLDTEHGLDDEAVKTAGQWTFRPGLKDGRAVPVRITIEMAFSISPKKRGLLKRLGL